MDKENIERYTLRRKDCPMRHENGNCLPHGGICTSVSDTVCEAMHNAYRAGKTAASTVKVQHGKWKAFYSNNIGIVYECSECGHLTLGISDYCICGAKMD